MVHPFEKIALDRMYPCIFLHGEIQIVRKKLGVLSLQALHLETTQKGNRHGGGVPTRLINL